MSVLDYKDNVQSKNVFKSVVHNSKQVDASVNQFNTYSNVFNSSRTGAETIISHKELSNLPSFNLSTTDFTRLEPTANDGSFGVETENLITFL